MQSERYKKVIEKIKESKNILLVTHYRPDGDAVASLCAMMEIAKSFDKKFTAFSYDVPPPQFSYLNNYEDIISEKSKLDFDSYDLIVVLDCGQLSRTKLTEEIDKRNSNQYIIEIDHHPKVHDYAGLEVRQAGLSSTCELLYNIVETNRIKINKELATALLTGIMTDTGNLLYSYTTERTIKIASELMKFGARFPLILENTWRNKSVNGMKIWGIAMRRLYINKKYNIAITILTRKDFEETMATDEEMEGIPGFLSSVSGADSLLILREQDNGFLKGSLRSMNKDGDVSRLAKRLGGGGHPMASAFTMQAGLVKGGDGWEVV